GKIIVGREADQPIFLDQVADVVDGEAERTSISRLNGQSSINIDILPIQGANIVELGDGIKKSVADLKARLPADVELTVTQSNSDDIKTALEQTKETIIEGAALTILIVFMFLHSWRSTVITALTLPISVIATFIVVHAMGFSLNMLTLMALSLSIGLLIDDAIVVRENIVRHLGMGKTHIQAALEGTQEIGLAVLATTFAIVVVFVPVAFMHGIIGRFFYQFGISVAVAVLVSLFVSFTLDPMLSSVWEDPEATRFKYAPWLGRLMARFEMLIEAAHRIYDRILRLALRNRWKTLGLAMLVFLASLFLTPFIGTEFAPQTDSGFIFVQVNTPVGSSLEYTDAKVRQVEDALKQFKDIEFVQTTVGTGNGKNYAEIGLKLVDRKLVKRRSQQELETQIRHTISSIAGLELSVGGDKQIFISILGPDEAKLKEIAADMWNKMAKIKGIADLESSEKAANPTVSVRIDNEAASDLGLSTSQIGHTLRPLVSGDTISHWLARDGQNYDVIVQLPQAGRRLSSDLGDLYLTSTKRKPDGTPQLVPLRQVASFIDTTSPTQLKRLDLQRRISLYANAEGRPSGDVGKDVQKLIKEANLPPGYRFETAGQQADMQDAFTAFVGAIGLAILFIYFILASQFGSFLQPVAIMFSLPFSLTGVLIALLVTHTTLNIFSMIGLIMLMGLVVKNAILLVDFANRARDEGRGVHEALLEAGQVRLRPILMTTAAMIFGMLPMAIGAGDGGETQAPMGRAIIGGVITSTLLTLVVVPVLYSFLDGFMHRLRKRREAGAVQPAVQPEPLLQPVEQMAGALPDD
ncbi:MAG: efflux RND transporter permease subunit, partial [Burkholderiales bacterium]|nr:efflux RND transporter permease subunit [Burkholderiales bacterium]